LLSHYYENDYSRFDSTIGLSLLELEVDIYRRFGLNKRCAHLMLTNLDRVGKTPSGVKYSVPGTRPSGDQNTSCGNTMLNGLLMAYALWCQRPLFEWQMAVMGDDNLTQSNRLYDTGHIEGKMRLLGMLPKLVHKTHFHFLEFVSCRFWPTPDGLVLGPKIGKFLVKVGWMLRPPTGEKRRAREYRGTLLSHVNSVGHVPVLNEVVQRMLELTAQSTTRFVQDNSRRLKNISIHTTTIETWNMIEDLYQLGKHDIDQINSQIANTFMGGVLDHPAIRRIVDVDC
jgi:hypothetical protein